VKLSIFTLSGSKFCDSPPAVSPIEFPVSQRGCVCGSARQSSLTRNHDNRLSYTQDSVPVCRKYKYVGVPKTSESTKHTQGPIGEASEGDTSLIRARRHTHTLSQYMR
jgi:hypothetical protein